MEQWRGLGNFAPTEQEFIMASSKAKKVLAAGLCAATLGGGFVSMTTPAEAQYGYQRRGYHPGYAYRRGPRAGAVAAGVVGGLALGALAAGAVRPAYAAPVYGVAPAYGDDCYVVRRRFVDAWGRTFTRRETVCE
jgi:hypothetical protein